LNDRDTGAEAAVIGSLDIVFGEIDR